ncbi:MAG: hypothetical protein GY802_03475, partial [Gammaproteobacteria bacterium]|nr:hypothetical protein [Gammaproteobacteria bacterium]
MLLRQWPGFTRSGQAADSIELCALESIKHNSSLEWYMTHLAPSGAANDGSPHCYGAGNKRILFVKDDPDI